jgi:glycosyltransferase involved in cell wall biosynthesis
VARRADRVVGPSAYLKGLVSGWGTPPEHIEIVHNSLRQEPTALSRAEARERLGYRSQVVLLSAGRLVPWKGFDPLIRLIPDLISHHPSLGLVIVGSGPCRAELEQLTRELSLNEAVTFTGPLAPETMAHHLRASDALVLLSSYEGFSHLLLEAMTAGLPVLAADVGGNRELIDNGKNGILVPLGERLAIKESLLELVRS